MKTDSSKFQNKYRIASARYTKHDYDEGIYYITICTANKQHYFGRIIRDDNAHMELSEIGLFAAGNLRHIALHYPEADIPLYVIMPNHIHLIMTIDTVKTSPVQTTGSKTLASPDRSHHKGRLSVVIGGFKAAVTKYAHANHIVFAWQTRFYEHIIRNQHDFDCVSDYIDSNVNAWCVRFK